MPASQARLKILNLCRWYPNRYDPMPGLFIQRHAGAAALYADVSAVYTHAVTDGKLSQTYEVELEEKNSVRTAIVYYRASQVKVPGLKQIAKIYRFLKANELGIQEISGTPRDFDVVHVHVLTRLGVLALYLKWKYGIPFVITEHWTRYLDSQQQFQGVLKKKATRMVVKRAAAVTAVSNDLIKAMQSHKLKNGNYRLIYNVVDPVFFDVPFSGKDIAKKELVHVSCFTDEQKNISGLLRVVKSLSEKRSDFHFTFVGDGADFVSLKRKATDLNIPIQTITFTGLLEGKALASTMAKADALVLFSNYENMPVVINESFVLGVPVFSTDVGGIAEMINSLNGVLVEQGDEQGMLKALNDFLDNKFSFDPDAIRESARKKFSPEAIGRFMLEIYQDASAKNPS